MKLSEIYTEIDGQWYVIAGKLRAFLRERGMEDSVKRAVPDSIPNAAIAAILPTDYLKFEVLGEALDEKTSTPTMEEIVTLTGPWQINVNELRYKGAPISSLEEVKDFYSETSSSAYESSRREEVTNRMMDEITDEITNEVMDAIRDLLSYRMGEDIEEEDQMVEALARALPNITVGDFDDAIYGVIHNRIKEMVRQGLITYKEQEPQPQAPQVKPEPNYPRPDPSDHYSSPNSIGLYRP